MSVVRYLSISHYLSRLLALLRHYAAYELLRRVEEQVQFPVSSSSLVSIISGPISNRQISGDAV